MRCSWIRCINAVFFFFQAEDGIRDYKVTGVQTCALPIWHTDRGGARVSQGLQALAGLQWDRPGVWSCSCGGSIERRDRAVQQEIMSRPECKFLWAELVRAPHRHAACVHHLRSGKP